MLIRKTFKFEAAHRLLNSYTERCRGIHGHSYVVELFIDGPLKEEDGMVVDFTLLKERFGGFLDMFDHALILWRRDPLVNVLLKDSPDDLLLMLNPRWIIFPQHPTAEMMAAYFYWKAYESLTNHEYKVHSVRVHETTTGYAECAALDQSLPMSELWKKVEFSNKCRNKQ